MKTSVKIALIIAALALALGIVLTSVGIYMMGMNRFDLLVNTYTPVTYNVTEDFADISVETDTHDVRFALSEKGECKIVCGETDGITHSVTVQNGTLIIKTVDNRSWYDHIGLVTKNHEIVLYLPQETYEDVTIKTDTGDVKATNNFLFANVDIQTDTGDMLWYAQVSEKLSLKADTGEIKLEGISTTTITAKTDTGNIRFDNATAKDITVESDTGDVFFKGCTVKGEFTLETNTGDVLLTDTVGNTLKINTDTGNVTFDNADGEKIVIKTNTGDVEGTLISEKIFFASTDTGKIKIPRSTSGGICEITSSTGDIKLEILNLNR